MITSVSKFVGPRIMCPSLWLPHAQCEVCDSLAVSKFVVTCAQIDGYFFVQVCGFMFLSELSID